MPAEKHKDYKEEIERFKYTLDYVGKSIIQMSGKKERIDKELEQSKINYNTEDSQAYIDLMVNTIIHAGTNKQVEDLNFARTKPYFARIDFKEMGKSEREKLYIGKMSLIKDDNKEAVIIDWRAPIANMYYESRLGKSSYRCPDGIVEGELTLKRQFSIDEGELREIFDIDITTNDEFLQKYLGASAENRLKDIVSTIQVEQNLVIRSDMWKPLIVQGAEGSGKTTIALHRIAYLIYTYQKSFKPDNFMIIATNKLFLNYISEVLPELGVDKVKQTTYEDFAIELIGKKIKIKDSNDKLTMFVNNNANDKEIKFNKFLRKESEIKSSMLFKDIIDDYIKTVEEKFIPKGDFKVAGFLLYKYEDINDLFVDEYKNLPMVKRIDEIKKHLTNRLRANKERMIDKLQLDCDEKIQYLKDNMEESDERRALIIEAIDYKNDTVKEIERLSKNGVKEYINKISNVDPVEHYKNFIGDEKNFKLLSKGRIDEETVDFIINYTMDNLNNAYVETEDVAPIVYMKYCIHGINEKIPVKHIVIDEAQDFSVFQFYVLKKIVKDSSFTILGDLSQGIHSYRGTKRWEDVQNYVFEGSSKILTLKESYRTTVEVMEAANKVISNIKDENLIPAKPVVRHGEKVSLIKKEGIKDTCEDIAVKIENLKNEKMKSIAVICKTIQECKKVQTSLKKIMGQETPPIITGKEKEYKGGILIVPSYLAKGLEFDGVIITNASKEEYTMTNTDTKLLYVAMTRALHRLYIYYNGEMSPLLKNV